MKISAHGGCRTNWKGNMKRTLIAFGLLAVVAVQAAERWVPDYLRKISGTIRAEAGYSKSEGSGTLFVRNVKDGNKTVRKVFVWTAGHVISDLRREESTLVNGKPSKKVVFDNPKILRELRNKDGRRTGEVVVDTKVLRYSPANKHDLALLMVMSEDFEAKESVEFIPKGAPLIRVGARLWHCGSMLGTGRNGEGSGHNSITDGVMSAHGRLLFKEPFCQTTANAMPGSSGGIIADERGRYVAMLVRGAGETFNLGVPVARMHRWSEANGIAWAMDAKKPVTLKEIEKLPIEGVAESGDQSGELKNYPFLIRKEKREQK